MDRSWLETVRLLGLDVVVPVVLALAAAHWGTSFAHKVLTRPDSERGGPASTDEGGANWPPLPWRTSH